MVNVVKALFDPGTYLRIGKGMAGGTLIIVGTGALVFVIANKATGGGATKAVKAVT